MRTLFVSLLLVGCASTDLSVPARDPANPRAPQAAPPALPLTLGPSFDPFADEHAGPGHVHESGQDHPGPAAKYTCPMHPEVKADAPGRCPKCGMKLEPVGGGK